MSRKLKSFGLFAVLLILLGILAYLLKDIKTRNNSETTQARSTSLKGAQYYNELGREYSRKGNYEESLKAFNKAIELAKNTKQFYVPYAGRAFLKYKLRDFDGVISDAKIALSGDSTLGGMYGLLGTIEYLRNDYKNSIINLTKSISLKSNDDPDLWLNYVYRGASEGELNNLENSKKDCFKALELNKNDYFIYNCIYSYYMSIKDFKIASIYFNKANHFKTDLDHQYYESGVGIYMQLFYSARDINDTKNTEIYGNLFLENANMANKLMPNAKNGYWLCLVNNELKLGNWMNVCQEALAKAKQEKNDEVYKDISDIMK